jgi:hypothetical protein
MILSGLVLIKPPKSDQLAWRSLMLPHPLAVFFYVNVCSSCRVRVGVFCESAGQSMYGPRIVVGSHVLTAGHILLYYLIVVTATLQLFHDTPRISSSNFNDIDFKEY